MKKHIMKFTTALALMSAVVAPTALTATKVEAATQTAKFKYVKDANGLEDKVVGSGLNAKYKYTGQLLKNGKVIQSENVYVFKGGTGTFELKNEWFKEAGSYSIKIVSGKSVLFSYSKNVTQSQIDELEEDVAPVDKDNQEVGENVVMDFTSDARPILRFTAPEGLKDGDKVEVKLKAEVKFKGASASRDSIGTPTELLYIRLDSPYWVDTDKGVVKIDKKGWVKYSEYLANKESGNYITTDSMPVLYDLDYGVTLTNGDSISYRFETVVGTVSNGAIYVIPDKAYKFYQAGSLNTLEIPSINYVLTGWKTQFQLQYEAKAGKN